MSEAVKVPASVLAQIRGSIEGLRGIERRLIQVRSLDDRFGGYGRYESESFDNFTREIEQSGFYRTLDRFRELAPKNGVDAEALIQELGGLPDLAMSERAQRYFGQYCP